MHKLYWVLSNIISSREAIFFSNHIQFDYCKKSEIKGKKIAILGYVFLQNNSRQWDTQALKLFATILFAFMFLIPALSPETNRR